MFNVVHWLLCVLLLILKTKSVNVLCYVHDKINKPRDKHINFQNSAVPYNDIIACSYSDSAEI